MSQHQMNDHVSFGPTSEVHVLAKALYFLSKITQCYMYVIALTPSSSLLSSSRIVRRSLRCDIL